MNEIFDFALTGAKITALNNKLACIAVHGLSAAYNIGHFSWYRYQYYNQLVAVSNSESVQNSVQINDYRREMRKYAVLSICDCVSLFLIALSHSKE